jgi:hypothetical protein
MINDITMSGNAPALLMISAFSSFVLFHFWLPVQPLPRFKGKELLEDRHALNSFFIIQQLMYLVSFFRFSEEYYFISIKMKRKKSLKIKRNELSLFGILW